MQTAEQWLIHIREHSIVISMQAKGAYYSAPPTRRTRSRQTCAAPSMGVTPRPSSPAGGARRGGVTGPGEPTSIATTEASAVPGRSAGRRSGGGTYTGDELLLMQPARVPNQVQITRRSRRPTRCFYFPLKAAGVDAVGGTAHDVGDSQVPSSPAGVRLPASMITMGVPVDPRDCGARNAVVRGSAGRRP
jgi:hypothetical protein